MIEHNELGCPHQYENLYLVDFNAGEAQLSICLLTKSSMGWLWHRRLGHVGIMK